MVYIAFLIVMRLKSSCNQNADDLQQEYVADVKMQNEP